MTLVYFLTQDGFIDHVDNVKNLDKVIQNHTTVDLPKGLHKPKFNGTEWVETMSDSEYESIIAQSKQAMPNQQAQMAMLMQMMAKSQIKNTQTQNQVKALQTMIMAQSKQIQAMKGSN